MLRKHIKRYLNEENSKLTEKRRNPEKNPKTTIDDFIGRVGKSSDSVFVRYSDTREDTSIMPLNPKYRYNNVWGKYMYPYEYWKEKSVHPDTGKYMGINNRLPFAGKMEYVNFYHIRMDEGIIDNQSPPFPKWALDKISEMIAMYPKREFSEDMREAIEKDDINLILDYYGYYSGYSDINIFDTHLLLWGCPYNLKLNPKEIRKLFLKVGINGFVDSKGEGYIHKNEPYQAVFLDKNPVLSQKTFPNKEVNRIKRTELQPSPFYKKYVDTERGVFTRKTKRLLDNIGLIKRKYGFLGIKFLRLLVNKSFALDPDFKGDLPMIINQMDGMYNNLTLWMNPPSLYRHNMEDSVLTRLYATMEAEVDHPLFSIGDFLKRYAKYSTDIEYDVKLLSNINGINELHEKIEKYIKKDSDKIETEVLDYGKKFIELYNKKYGYRNSK